jgi:hypothetical protein
MSLNRPCFHNADWKSRLGENVAGPLQEFLDAEKKPCNEENIPNYLLFCACIWYLPAIKE